VEASSSLGQDVIGWRLSKISGETDRKKLISMQHTRVYYSILAAENPALDTTNTYNYLEMKGVAQQKTLPRTRKVHVIVEMWQGTQILCVTQKKSGPQNKQMTAVRYISDTQEFIKVSWSYIQIDGVAALILSERSPGSPDC